MKLTIASEDEILKGESTDQYFLTTMKVLERKNSSGCRAHTFQPILTEAAQYRTRQNDVKYMWLKLVPLCGGTNGQ